VITLKRFRRLEQALHEAGHGEDAVWAEELQAPTDATGFARAAIYVIVNSGMSFRVAQGIYARCWAALERSGTTRRVFGHRGKRRAIDTIWIGRERLFEDFTACEDKLAFCESLPWIGPTTKYHLSKDLGVDVAKPDVHLARLALRDRTTVERMCTRLSRQTGYRLATVDTILWRACATGILDSKRYELEGWRAAFRGKPKIQH
jgi:hypothetical protein